LGVAEHIGYLAEASPSAVIRTEIIDSTIQHYFELKQWHKAEKELQSELQRNLY